MHLQYLVLYGGVLLLLWGAYLWNRRRVQRRDAQQLQESREAGLDEPASLHPVVNAARCLGSGACVKACPEGAIGLVGGKAVLINGSACIGHGACAAACPMDAIQLVFGSEKRGVDIPNVTPQFESHDVPGLFIAGELGGMGLIAKAAEQGRQAMEAIGRRPRGDFDHDVVIVGCGPAGFSAGLAALEKRLRYKIIEQEPSLGGAVFHYPRHKVAMTVPVTLALVGKVRFGEVRKEKLLEFWQGAMRQTGLKIGFNERMVGIERERDGFVVVTAERRYRTRSVLLALGRRGTPRKLEVPGEESAKVVYRLIDAAQYDGQAVLVVGGGDSALEAALALAERPGARVTLAYRGDAFSRVKGKNRAALEAARRAGQVDVRLATTVERIDAQQVVLRTPQGSEMLPNDAVIVCAGGQLPTPLLQAVGVSFETKFGTA